MCAIGFCDHALTRERREPPEERLLFRMAAQQRIGAEAAPGRVSHEQRKHDSEENVIPRPLGRVAIKPEPQMERDERAAE